MMKPFDARTRTQLDVCLMQWLGSAPCTAIALAEGIALGIDRVELERNRRAQSSDPDLQRLLRFAVAIVIARGRVTRRERTAISDIVPEVLLLDLVAHIAGATYRAYVSGALALHADSPSIDMSVGDY